MINGTQLITSIGAEALERAGIIARQADVVAALTLEVLKGSSRAFDPGKTALKCHSKCQENFAYFVVAIVTRKYCLGPF